MICVNGWLICLTNNTQKPLIAKLTYPNTPLKSTCASIEFDKFKAKIDNEGPYSDG